MLKKHTNLARIHTQKTQQPTPSTNPTAISNGGRLKKPYWDPLLPCCSDNSCAVVSRSESSRLTWWFEILALKEGRCWISWHWNIYYTSIHCLYTLCIYIYSIHDVLELKTQLLFFVFLDLDHNELPSCPSGVELRTTNHQPQHSQKYIKAFWHLECWIHM